MQAVAALPINPVRSISLVARGVLLETIRRQEFYVLFILMGVYVLGMIVTMVVGIENKAVGTFLLNLGMTMAYYSAMVLTLLTAARQVPTEMENRTLYPLLGKPLGRGEYLVGKWLAAAGIGATSLAVLMALAWIGAPRMEEYDAMMLAQTMILAVLSVSMLAALALAFSLVAPQAVNVVVLGLLVVVGDAAVGFARARAAPIVGPSAAQWITAYIPNFSILDTVTRYTDGIGPLDGAMFVGLAAYAVVYTGLALAAGAAIFGRRSL